MPLSMLAVGEMREIKDLRGNEDAKRHLKDLGFVKGEQVKILQENGSGLILLVKNVRIAISRAMASKIIVTN